MDEIDEQLQNELMPNAVPAGIWEPAADPELDQEAEAERAAIARTYPVVEELLEWFDAQIAAADSIKQVMVTKEAKKIGLTEALHAHDIVRLLLEHQRDDLRARFESFKSVDAEE